LYKGKRLLNKLLKCLNDEHISVLSINKLKSLKTIKQEDIKYYEEIEKLSTSQCLALFELDDSINNRINYVANKFNNNEEEIKLAIKKQDLTYSMSKDWRVWVASAGVLALMSLGAYYFGGDVYKYLFKPKNNTLPEKSMFSNVFDKSVSTAKNFGTDFSNAQKSRTGNPDFVQIPVPDKLGEKTVNMLNTGVSTATNFGTNFGTEFSNAQKSRTGNPDFVQIPLPDNLGEKTINMLKTGEEYMTDTINSSLPQRPPPMPAKSILDAAKITTYYSNKNKNKK